MKVVDISLMLIYDHQKLAIRSKVFHVVLPVVDQEDINNNGWIWLQQYYIKATTIYWCQSPSTTTKIKSSNRSGHQHHLISQ